MLYSNCLCSLLAQTIHLHYSYLIFFERGKKEKRLCSELLLNGQVIKNPRRR